MTDEDREAIRKAVRAGAVPEYSADVPSDTVWVVQSSEFGRSRILLGNEGLAKRWAERLGGYWLRHGAPLGAQLLSLAVERRPR